MRLLPAFNILALTHAFAAQHIDEPERKSYNILTSCSQNNLLDF